MKKVERELKDEGGRRGIDKVGKIEEREVNEDKRKI